MLRTIQRIVQPPAPLPPRDWSVVKAWAEGQGLTFKREKEDRGFALLGQVAAPDVAGEAPASRAWRLEWGPSQREYIEGPELRIRASMGLPAELQMLLMPLPLMDRLERETFSRFTQQAQTEIDIGMPEEMRWLALFRRTSMTPWKQLRSEVGAVAAIAGTAEAWLQNEALQSALMDAVHTLPGFVLMTLRSRLYLRLPLAEPHTGTVGAALALLNTAAPALGAVLEAIGRRAADGASAHGSTGFSDAAPGEV
jgi:hypothetical protein